MGWISNLVEVPSQGSVIPGSGWQSLILETPVCEPDGGAEPYGGQTEGRKRGLSKSIQQPLRAFLSKIEPEEASVDLCSPCTWPWCLVLSRRRRKGFMERRNGNLRKPVLLF